MDIDAVISELPDEFVEYVANLQDENESLSKRLAETATGDDDLDPVAKALGGLGDEDRAVVEAELEKAREHEVEIAKRKDDEADNVFIEKARAFDGVGDPDELGPALRRLHDSDEEATETILKALTAAAEQTSTGDLFAELGHAITKSTDAESQIDAIAKSYTEANPALSEAEARAKAWEDNEELYAEHSLAQRERQRH